MIGVGLLDPRHGTDQEQLARLSKKSPDVVRARVLRFQVWQMAKLLHQWPEEVEEMPLDWWVDANLFEATERYVASAKGRPSKVSLGAQVPIESSEGAQVWKGNLLGLAEVPDE